MDYTNLQTMAWLVDRLRRAGENGVTYDELVADLVSEVTPECGLNKRRFHMYLNELREKFGIQIECDRHFEKKIKVIGDYEGNRRYRYRIVYEPKGDEVPWTMPYLWALDAASAMKYIRDNPDTHDYVLIDNDPSGTYNVRILLDAIRQHRCVNLKYNDPNYGFPYAYDSFAPLGLMMKNYRWYLLGKKDDGAKVVWPLSRITDIEVTNVQYEVHAKTDLHNFIET